jgi:MFS family permease
VPALRAGGRYVWHEPVVRRIMLRAIIFVAPAMGLWALLPLIASQHLGVGPDGFGALFAALGTGAIVGALLLARLKTNLSTNSILTAAAELYAAALAVIILVPSFPVALATLLLSGVAWMAMTSTLQAEMLLVLPGWVRARGMALYTMIFMGSPTAGALLWGVMADGAGLRPAVLASGVVVLLGVGVGLLRRVPRTGHLDPQPAVYWTDPQLAFKPEPDTGPVPVAVHFSIAPERQTDFLRAMGQLRQSDSEPGRRVGSCIETANDRTNSWRPSASPHGRNISASTRAA